MNLSEHGQQQTLDGIDYASSPNAFNLPLAAHIVLDYLSARFALQSSDLRRMVPFRRRTNAHHRESRNLWEVDSITAKYAVLAGNYSGLEHDRGSCYDGRTPDCRWPSSPSTWIHKAGSVVHPAAGSYRVPELLLDLMIDKEENAYFYWSTPLNRSVEIKPCAGLQKR